MQIIRILSFFLLVIPLFGNSQTFFQNQSDSLFQTDPIATIHLQFSKEDWLFLINDPERQDYAPAQLAIFGETLKDSVGVRFKGSFGTLWSCVDENDSITCPKLSMKVDVNFKSKKQRLFGVKKFSLHSMVNDGSKMREILAYDLYRKEGIPAPRVTWAKVLINQKNYGIFALVEQVDNKFIDYQWPNQNHGILYKEAYPNNTDSSFFYAQQKTKKDSLTYKRFKDFSLECYNASYRGALDSFIDMGTWVKYIALETMINNWDGITTFYCSPIGACKPHNYYWYLVDGKFHPILWDTDLSFSVRSLWKDFPEWYEDIENCNIIDYPGGAYLRPAQCDGLFRFTKKFYFDEYLDSLKVLKERHLSGKYLEGELNKWYQLLENHIPREIPEAHWENEIKKLRATLNVMEDQVNDELMGQQWNDLTFDASQQITFNETEEFKLVALLKSGTSKNAFFNISKTDESFSLLFNVDTSNKEVLNTWGEVFIPFSAPLELTQESEFQIELSEKLNTIWQISLASNNYTDPSIHEYFTLDLKDNAEQQMVLNLSDVKMYKWAGVNDFDNLDEILKGVNGIYLKPIYSPNKAITSEIHIKSIYFKK